MKSVVVIGLQSYRKEKLNITKNDLFEPCNEKTSSGFQPGPTQTRLYSYRIWLEA